MPPRQCPRFRPPRVYYSQRRMATQATLEESLQEIVCRTRLLVLELQEEGFFAETFGFSCIDDFTPRRETQPHLLC